MAAEHTTAGWMAAAAGPPPACETLAAAIRCYLRLISRHKWTTNSAAGRLSMAAQRMFSSSRSSLLLSFEAGPDSARGGAHANELP
jgi:hypothetical protein